MCRDGWGPSPARQVSLAPLTMRVSEVAQGPTKKKRKTRRDRELRMHERINSLRWPLSRDEVLG